MLRAEKLYPDSGAKTSNTSTPLRPERRGVSRRRVIGEAKEKVPVFDLAERLCGPGGLRKAGKEWVGRCPLPDHEDKTPSMTVYVDRQTFRCFGCGAHGDVLDLVQLVEGCELWEAVIILSQRHGVELPGRPESWHRRQERQKPVRDAIGKARFDHLCRRLFRLYFKDVLLSIEDPAEREIEYEILWDSTKLLARMMLRDLGGEGKP